MRPTGHCWPRCVVRLGKVDPSLSAPILRRRPHAASELNTAAPVLETRTLPEGDANRKVDRLVPTAAQLPHGRLGCATATFL